MMNVTILGAAANLILSGGKGIVGYMSNSTVLIADAAHSVTDSLSDIITLIALKLRLKPANLAFPFGYGKFETLGAVFVSGIILSTGCGIVYHSAEELIPIVAPYFGSMAQIVQAPGHHHSYGLLPLICASSSVVIKEALYQVTYRIGHRSNSKLIEANAWHHRSDAYSSIVAVIGIAGHQLGLVGMDPLAGAIIGSMLIKVGVEYTWVNFKDFLDPVDATTQRKTDAYLHHFIAEEEEKHNIKPKWTIKNIRARKSGNESFVDFSLHVPPDLSAKSITALTKKIKTGIRSNVPFIRDVTIHIRTL
eukprot:TRINITY_DN18710_c0_g1_i1.p1 TRINITY_DN18710_c0_g1~~TRINITY_DN18710_c0_g1_i1.p1  ORF type:complete len:306 (+),score=43.50 TRINITY_DN18710_c0_g1_i1:2-919(+)